MTEIKLDDRLKSKLTKLAETNETTLEEVMILFNVLRDEVKEMCPYLTNEKLNYRTYNGIEDHYSNKKFSNANEFSFIPFGIFSEAKDKNKDIIDKIVKDFAKPNMRLEMIAGKKGDGSDAKVISMKTSDQEIDGKDVLFTDVFKPVKNIKNFISLDNGQFVVTEGELWNPGDNIIPRDYRTEIQYVEGGETYTNKNWSKPLKANWKLILFGVGFFDGVKQIKDKEGNIVKVKKNMASDGLICKVDFYGDEANPTSPKFIPSKNPFFKPCKFKAVSKQFSNELFLSITAKLGKTSTFEIDTVTKIKFSNWVDKNGNERKGLIPIINERVGKQSKKAQAIYNSADLDEMPKDKAKKLQSLYNLYKKYLNVDYIPFIDLCDIDNYHKTHRAKHDAQGNIIKDEKGVWDDVDFDSFALAECNLKGFYTPDDKDPKMILSDMSIDDAIFPKFANGLDTEIKSAQVLISLTTSRGNQAYDVETSSWVENPDEAIAMPKVKGVGLLIDFRKMNIKHLSGDI